MYYHTSEGMQVLWVQARAQVPLWNLKIYDFRQLLTYLGSCCWGFFFFLVFKQELFQLSQRVVVNKKIQNMNCLENYLIPSLFSFVFLWENAIRIFEAIQVPPSTGQLPWILSGRARHFSNNAGCCPVVPLSSQKGIWNITEILRRLLQRVMISVMKVS